MRIEPFDLLGSPLDGRNLIEASAGTGKTYTIAALFLRLLLEARLPADRILVVTFTEAATEELRARIRARVREACEACRRGGSKDPFLERLLERVPPSEATEALLLEAIHSLDTAPVFTIHGFCQKVLQEKAFECGAAFDAELLTDDRPLLQEVVEDFWRREVYPASRAFAAYVNARRLDPQVLVEFLVRKARAPVLRVLPEEAAQESDELESRCEAAMGEVRRLWPEAREEVLDLFRTHPGLNRNRYRSDSVPGWGLGMAEYLAAGDPLGGFDALSKFCSSHLAGAVKRGQEAPSHPFFDACEELAALREALRSEFEARVRALKVRLIRHARIELPRRKGERNVRAFDDLLRLVREALDGPGGPSLARALRERYPAALVDEFQDTDPVQYAIFRAIYPDPTCRLFLIGDPKQAIYGFRGADVFAYMEASRNVDRHWTLEENWRSVPGLVQAINALFGNAPAPFVFERISFHPAKPASREDWGRLLAEGEADPRPLRLWLAGSGDGNTLNRGDAERRDLPAAVAGEVVRLLAAGAQGRAFLGADPLGPEHLAVLVRTNRQARYVQEALAARGVPSALYSAQSLFDAPEAEEMLRVLSALADPGSERRVRGALVADLFGVSADDLSAGDDAWWDGWLQRLDRYHGLWAERGFVVMARSLLSQEGVRARLLSYPDGERRLTNVLHLVEVLHRAAAEEKLGPEGLVQWLGLRIEERPAEDEYQLRLETDERAVKIVTVHKSKGLEYPIAFCPFGWGGSREKGDEVVFHDPDAPTRVVLDLGTGEIDAHRKLTEREALAENLRLLYVAVTRARNRCYLVWGPYRGAETSALAHLLHPPAQPEALGPEEVVDRLETRVRALSDGERLGQMQALARRANPSVGVEAVPEPGIGGFEPPVPDDRPLSCRPFRGRIPADWGIASFSSLVSGREEAAELPDRDEGTWAPPPEPAGGPPSPAVASIFDFPAGAKAGRCFHAILEEADYRADDRAALEGVVAAKLDLHGFDREWTGPVSDALDRVFRAPLEAGDPESALCRVPREARVNELEFYLPAGRLTPRGLAGAFGAGGPGAPWDLAAALRNLGFRPVRGFLKGFVDLVFCSGGRYHLVDWKSNHLGSQVEDYGPEGLRRAMDEHLYGLQYHLYAVALHRHLASRLLGYDYDRHFGSVYYVFLRGVDPSAPELGIYRARPDRALLEALSDHLERGG